MTPRSWPPSPPGTTLEENKPAALRNGCSGIDLASLAVDPDIRFPGESGEYRRERNRLLEAEIELRRAIERVATQRRALPPGGPVADDE